MDDLFRMLEMVEEKFAELNKQRKIEMVVRLVCAGLPLEDAVETYNRIAGLVE